MPRKKLMDQNFNPPVVPDSISVTLTTGNIDLVNINKSLTEVNSQLKKTHLGHETGLWGQEVDSEE